MPSLAEHTASKFVKIIYMGDAGSGKTGSLASLVKAGYRLRVLDFDKGLESLVTYVKETCPERLGTIDYVSVTDTITAGALGPITKPAAFVAGTKLMGKWEDDSIPSEWGHETIFVIDSLSAYGRAAFQWAKGMNVGAKDPRQWYFAAQQGVEDAINLLTSENFKTNVIIISHINYKEVNEGETRGYVNAIGTALGPILPRYFNTLVMCQKQVLGKTVKRSIYTIPTNIVDLKTPIPPSKLPDVLPLETGLATIFAALKGQ